MPSKRIRDKRRQKRKASEINISILTDYTLSRLEEKGLIDWDTGKQRGRLRGL